MNAALRFAMLRFFVGLLSVFFGVFGFATTASASASRGSGQVQNTNLMGRSVCVVANVQHALPVSEHGSHSFCACRESSLRVTNPASSFTDRTCGDSRRSSSSRTGFGLNHGWLSQIGQLAGYDVSSRVTTAPKLVATNTGVKFPGNATQALETIEHWAS
jgi:hypothetical protein